MWFSPYITMILNKIILPCKEFWDLFGYVSENLFKQDTAQDNAQVVDKVSLCFHSSTYCILRLR